MHKDAGNGLALAIVASSTEPLLLLDQDQTVIAASASFCLAFHIEPIGIAGQRITDLGSGEWNVPQLKSLLSATASGSAQVDAYELELKVPGLASRQLVLNAEKLVFGGPETKLLLLAVADVTDQRLAVKVRDDLVREKAAMLKELQHRVANSLQIIASVLLQSARKVQSEETRGHLHNAHHRVMSVAAVQRQLVTTGEPEVGLAGYFTELCASIAASMIPDPGQLTLSVECDASATDSETSVSLGLIITELVINALKHGFPPGHRGMIKVSYRSRGANWSMSVTDNGVGMPTGGAEKPGLGTSIVRALATQLKADVRVVDMTPGTAVLIEHKAFAGPGVEPPMALAV
nr:sensor histidine kinase [Caulobacter hibisci]